jgi:hypothetical protein
MISSRLDAQLRVRERDHALRSVQRYDPSRKPLDAEYTPCETTLLMRSADDLRMDC